MRQAFPKQLALAGALMLVLFLAVAPASASGNSTTSTGPTPGRACELVPFAKIYELFGQVSALI